MKKITLPLLILTLVFISCDDLPTGANTDSSNDTDEFGTNRYSNREMETALGDMISDAAVWYIENQIEASYKQNIDFACFNGGIFDGGLPKGPVTAAMIPGLIKSDTLAIVALPGSKVTELFTYFASLPQSDNGWSQVSKEARFTIDYTQGQSAGQLKGLTIKGEALDPDKTYYVCTSDILVQGKHGGHNYPVLTAAENQVFTGVLVSEAITTYVSAQTQPFEPETDGRITIIGGY
ncbi:MAG: 5'-nucleotidase C-terminal domain-containing protein [Treponema sp.]|jgi:5'-nucleotidase/UDP-sugar diphosphatase|nr:5'-nucleotidase C-terminal domain-containing protein [Treponema sp.]